LLKVLSENAVLGDFSIIKSKLQPVCDGFLGIPAVWNRAKQILVG
jgi:hypothetical protein